jgi:hypothetical protein
MNEAQQWEYITLTSAVTDAALNRLGKQGWELVSVIIAPQQGNAPPGRTLYFKRLLGFERWSASDAAK